MMRISCRLLVLLSVHIASAVALMNDGKAVTTTYLRSDRWRKQNGKRASAIQKAEEQQ